MTFRNTVAATGLIALLGAGLAGGVLAQSKSQDADMMQEKDPDHTMEGMDHGGMSSGDPAQSKASDDTAGAATPAMPGSPATEAYRAANLAMHSAMDIEFSDDADIDFARGMIGHHQGAIDMARIMLEHGEDPDMLQLAQEIIEAQEAEIAFLQSWIAEKAE